MRIFKQKGSRVWRVRYTLSNGVFCDRPLHTSIKEVAEASLEVAGRSHEMLVVASATTILLGVGPRA